MHASEPGFGGSIEIGPFLPLSERRIENAPLGASLMPADFTAPWSPFASLYLKPLPASPDQKGLPVLLVPWFSTNTWLEGLAPFTAIVSTAPPAFPACVGSPTSVFGLGFSFALPFTVRLVGSLGVPLTVIDLPRM